MRFKGVKAGVCIALVGILAGGGGAYAAGQITGAQIKDGTITTKDIKKGTISARNLSTATLKGLTGPAGPAGATGPAGPAGASAPNVLGSPITAGAKGDPGEPGAQGLQGLTGASGAKGAAGTPGAKGDTGTAGAPGAKGDKGEPGPAGGNNITQIVGDPVPNGSSEEEWLAVAVAVCPDGQAPVGGAFIQDVASLGEVYYNAPDEDDVAWIVAGANWADPDNPDLAEGALQSIAYCAPSPTASKAPFAQRHAAALRSAQAVAERFHKQRR